MALALSWPDCRTEFRTRELPPDTGVACPACGSRMVVPGLPVARPLTEPDPPRTHSQSPRRRP
jgi:DNA-directed RNA polymerase subunit RPC12/RpoP